MLCTDSADDKIDEIFPICSQKIGFHFLGKIRKFTQHGVLIYFQEIEKKKKKKPKGVVRAERDTDFGDIAAAGRGDFDDYYDDEFI